MQADADLETALLGPVLPGRSCGDCTVCCTVLKVDAPELRKPAGVPCVALGARGCAIHATRPDICRTWFCAWRRVAALPDAARPDRSGLLVSVNFVREARNCLEAVSLNVRALPGTTAIADGTAATVLDTLCEGRGKRSGDGLIPVWFSDGAEKMLMHPPADVAAHVIAGTPAPPPLAAEVAAWRARYGLFDADGDGA